jgi:hypothetical protein
MFKPDSNQLFGVADIEKREQTTPLISIDPVWLAVPAEPIKQKKKLNPDLVSDKQMRGVRDDS